MVENGNGSSDPMSADGLREIIEKAKRELEHMMDLNPQVMLLVDPEGRVVRTNRSLLRFLGLESFGGALNMPLASLLQFSDTEFVAELLGASGLRPLETQVTLPDGRERSLLFSIMSAGDNDLRVVTIDDVTLEKEESVHLEKEHKMAAVEALMGALMHNINQPLTVIMVTARLMHLALEKGTWDAEEFKKSLQEIMDLTMKVARLLDRAQRPKDFVTEEYLEGMDIMDLNRSTAPDDDEPADR